MLTPEREQEIREHASVLTQDRPDELYTCFGCELLDLLAEIDRLRAKLAREQRQVERYRDDYRDMGF